MYILPILYNLILLSEKFITYVLSLEFLTFISIYLLTNLTHHSSKDFDNIFSKTLDDDFSKIGYLRNNIPSLI